MDHCPLPPGKGHIKIRNFTTSQYTTGPQCFLGYPDRQGWSSHDLNSRDLLKTHSPEKVRDFFQRWLFFGCVIEFLATCDVPAQHSDFLTSDGKYVTTQCLPQMLKEWKQQATKKRQPHDTLKIPAAMQTALILGTVRDFVDDYCLPGGGGQGLPANMRAQLVAQSPLPQRVWMSIIALGHALTKAMIEGFDIQRTGSRWGGSMALEQRMLGKGWCPMDVQRAHSDSVMSISEQYYLAKKENNDLIISHEGCTEFECRGRNIDEKTYRQLHERSCEKRICGGFKTADIGLLTKIIKDGDIPVFKWNLETKKLELRAVKVDGRGVGYPPFMAISHVWSDGLGNPRENAIFECQLEALQNLVESAAKRHKMVAGMPQHFWIDTLCVPVDPRFKELRKKCIRDMWRIYESSSTVLVLSSLRNTATTAKWPERQIAEEFSNWDRRLWTYQECIMARKRLIQYSDKTVDHVSIEADFFRDKLWGKGRYAAAEPLPPYASNIASRSTSKKSDEMLCMATLMRLDIEPFLEAEALLRKEKGISETAEISDLDLADKRMEIFWRSLGVCQRGVIFNSHRRLTTKGLRWAPATFLGSPWGGFVKRVDEGFCRLDKQGRGLGFAGQAIIIETPPTWKVESRTLAIDVTDKRLGSVCIEVNTRDLSYPSQTFTWIPGKKYVIVLEQSLSLHAPTKTGDSISKFKLPKTSPELELWLEQVFQPGRLNKLVLNAIVATVKQQNVGGACQISHECIAAAKIVNSAVLNKLEEEKYTIWDERSRQLLSKSRNIEGPLGGQNDVNEREQAHYHYDSDEDDEDDSDEDDSDDDDNDDDDSDDNDDDGFRRDHSNDIVYYDDLEPTTDSEEENEDLPLEVDNDALDSGSETADENCYRLVDGKQSLPTPPSRLSGILTSDDAKWFLL